MVDLDVDLEPPQRLGTLSSASGREDDCQRSSLRLRLDEVVHEAEADTQS